MTVDELLAHFPEIPRNLRDEPVIARFADVCDGPLRVARKPSPCSTGHDAENHYYLKLVGPLSILGYGLASREKTLGEIRNLVERCESDPKGFPGSLVPGETAEREVRGPGCE